MRRQIELSVSLSVSADRCSIRTFTLIFFITGDHDPEKCHLQLSQKRKVYRYQLFK